MVIRIGHRGCAYVQENTLAAFKKAINFGVEMIEFDIWQCKSGELVVFHDADLKRLFKVDKKIKDLSYSQLKKFNVPLLEDVLDLAQGKVKVNIELKDKVAKEVVSVIKDFIKKGFLEEDFLVSSFDYDELKRFHKVMPDILIGLLPENTNFAKQIEELSPYSVHLAKEKLSKGLVDRFHKKGLKVFTYTVNSNFEKVIALGVDGIFSDYPDKIPGHNSKSE